MKYEPEIPMHNILQNWFEHEEQLSLHLNINTF